MKLRLQTFLICALLGCGPKNTFDCDAPSGVPCDARTKDEDARVALDNGDMETAVTILSQLVEDEPTVYRRYPLLAAALAGRAGFDVFNVVKSSFGESDSLLESMGAFLPTPTSKGDAYDDSLSDMSDSVATLKLIPDNFRAEVNADQFASSCDVQLTLYQAAYSIMLINKYSYGDDGFDPSKLQDMSPEDAAAILKNLLEAGSIQVEGNEKTSQAISKAYEEIQSKPGATDQEKIAAYVESNRNE